MSAFLSLPPLYRVAVLLGARVEVYIKRQDQWCAYHQCIFSYDTPLRLKEGDESLLEQAHQMVPQFYDTVEFKGYDYLVPKVAMKPGTIVEFEYGFGAFGRVQEDGRVLEVSEMSIRRFVRAFKKIIIILLWLLALTWALKIRMNHETI